MKTIYIPFIIALFLLVSCGEENKTKTTTPNESLQSTQEPVQQVDTSAQEGDFVASNTYDAKKMNDGKFESFYPDKTLKAEGMVTNGKREGVWTSYHPNGNKQSENEYVNGVLHGKTYTTYPNGQIMYIGYYSEGKYDGQWVYYTPEGELSKEVLYKKGEIIQVKKGEDYNK